MAKIKKNSFRTVYLPLDEYQQEENEEKEEKICDEMNLEKNKVPTQTDSYVDKTEEINDQPQISKNTFQFKNYLIF
jgi:predicted RNA-binding protein (virulence factor B family)